MAVTPTIGAGYIPAVLSVSEQLAEVPTAPADAVADIADPTTATTEDVANKVNELLAALRLAGYLAV